MKPRRLLFTPFLALLLAATSSVSAETLKVLYFTKSSGYEHAVVRRGEQGAPSYSENVLMSLAKDHDLEFTFSKDGSLISAEYLAQFDVVFFYTSGYLQRVGRDGNPPMSPQGKQDLLEWVAEGNGFMAVHAGGDSFHSFETMAGNPPQSARMNRYRNNGEASDSYIKMLGGEFINHGPQQVATARVVDPKFPGFGDIGEALHIQEEWYSLKDFSPLDHVLLVMETEGMEGSDYDRPDFPLAWAKPYGRGRVWYNGMGHREDVWDSAAFQSMLVGAIEWAGKRVNADITPNIAEVTPGYQTMPPPRQ